MVDEERERLAGGAGAADRRGAGRDVLDRLAALETGPGPARVINATGVIVHTNLGRAPWPRGGDRGCGRGRGGDARSWSWIARPVGAAAASARPRTHLIALTGAEDALIVDEQRGGARAGGRAGRRAAASSCQRGELVEIGGGVRIPEIIRRAGARLIEVGTTNRTRVADFEEALADGQGAARPARPPVELRAGTGSSRRPTRRRWPSARARATARSSSTTSAAGRCWTRPRSGSPTSRCPRERLAAGADLVTFSGDKLVGGPQAGLIVGRARPRGAAAARPAGARDATRQGDPRGASRRRSGCTAPASRHARDPGLAADRGAGRRRSAERAAALVARDGAPSARASSETRSTVGGGSLPGETLPSWALALDGAAADGAAAPAPRRRRRRSSAGSRTTRSSLDLRTVEPGGRRGARAARSAPAPAGRRPRPTVVIGTAGHIDHGKTTLLRALTGIDADRLPEERRRGMTIDVGYAHLALADGRRARLRRRAGPRPAGRQHARRARARSTPRCWSSPPTTGRAPRRSSTSSCSTRSAIRARARGRDEGGPRRRPSGSRRSSTAVAALLARTSLAGCAGAAPCRRRRARGSRRCGRRSSSAVATERLGVGRRRRATRDRPRVRGAGPRHRGDRAACAAVGSTPGRRCGSCPAASTCASARSRSARRRVERPTAAGRRCCSAASRRATSARRRSLTADPRGRSRRRGSSWRSDARPGSAARPRPRSAADGDRLRLHLGTEQVGALVVRGPARVDRPRRIGARSRSSGSTPADRRRGRATGSRSGGRRPARPRAAAWSWTRRRRAGVSRRRLTPERVAALPRRRRRSGPSAAGAPRRARRG